jgi:NADH:ubiquinone oxidoreductase subunit 6 (subunit J)
MAAMPVVLWGAAGSTPPVELWSLLLPVFLGGLGIYFLLPRPHPYPTWLGASLGTLALVLAGFLLVRGGVLWEESVLFYAFSAIAVVSGALLVTQHNPARAALSFTLVILSTCGLFLLLAAPFLMAATIIIYAGAIIVTFLFVLMLAQQAGLSDADLRSREPLFSAVAGFTLLAALLYVLELTYGTTTLDELLARTRRAAAQETPEQIVQAVGKEDKLFTEFGKALEFHGLRELRNDVENEVIFPWPRDGKADAEKMKELLGKLEAIGEKARQKVGLGMMAVQPPAANPEKMSSFSGPSAVTAPGELRRDPTTGVPQLPAENSAYLGRSLFTDYLLPIELGGFLLMVAVIGSIAIAQRGGKPEGTR